MALGDKPDEIALVRHSRQQIVLPEPDGPIATADKYQLLGLYYTYPTDPGRALLGTLKVRPAVIGSLQVCLNIGADSDVSLTGLMVESLETYLNSATISAQIRDEDEAAVGDAISLSYQGGNGNYLGTFDQETTSLLEEYAYYFVDVSILQGSYDDFRRVRERALYHEYTP